MFRGAFEGHLPVAAGGGQRGPWRTWDQSEVVVLVVAGPENEEDIQGETAQKAKGDPFRVAAMREKTNPMFSRRFVRALRSGSGLNNGQRRHTRSFASVWYHIHLKKFSGRRASSKHSQGACAEAKKNSAFTQIGIFGARSVVYSVIPGLISELNFLQTRRKIDSAQMRGSN